MTELAKLLRAAGEFIVLSKAFVYLAIEYLGLQAFRASRWLACHVVTFIRFSVRKVVGLFALVGRRRKP